MAVTPENNIGLKESFQKVDGAEVSLRLQQIETAENFETRKLDQFVADELLSGKGDASILQMGRRVIASAAGAVQELALKGAERQKKADSDAHFRNILSLIKDGQVNSYIADEVFDDKTDIEIASIVKDIEAATGDSFEVYAKGVLGDNVPERLPNEDKADYQRRVLKDITEEILDPETGEIKPEYKDDPVAKFIKREEAYQNTRDDIKDIKARVEQEGVTAEINAKIDSETANNYSASELFGYEIEVETEASLTSASDNQDIQSDIKTNSAELVSESDSFFDDIGIADSKIASASEAGKAEFNQKSQDITVTDVSPTLDIDLDIKPT